MNGKFSIANLVAVGHLMLHNALQLLYLCMYFLRVIWKMNQQLTTPEKRKKNHKIRS